MKPKWAECVFDWERGWTVVQSRYNGKENFNRPMKAYKNGFGCPVGDGRKWDNTHWLVSDNSSEFLVVSPICFTLSDPTMMRHLPYH